MAIIHPQFSPNLLTIDSFLIPIIDWVIGPLSIRWYGLMYVAAFISFLIVCRMQIKWQTDTAKGFNKQEVDDILFFGAVGVILGGRLGYVIFYKLSYYIEHFNEILQLWQGGMSFHGGFIGVVFALTLWAKSRQKSILQLGDFIAPAIPLGLAAGRIGNFINGELWGRTTNIHAWWAMVFPQAGDLAANVARHPSQLYQAGLEGFTLFIIVALFARKQRPKGSIMGLFIAGYGVCRFIVEFAREPDQYLGLLTFGLSMGQILSIPMIILGIYLMVQNKLKKITVL